MDIKQNQIWKDSRGTYVVDGIFIDDKVRCHRICTTEEVIFKMKDFEKLEFLRLQEGED